ncbi:MAG: BMP family ABC transporter substrate-binding protein, partial [Candidatus Limnocylindria bacterium]
DFSMVAKGGAALAPINADVVGGIPDDLAALIAEREAEIKDGTFRVDINEATPPGATIPDA